MRLALSRDLEGGLQGSDALLDGLRLVGGRGLGGRRLGGLLLGLGQDRHGEQRRTGYGRDRNRPGHFEEQGMGHACFLFL
jgi:hypothetical protein